MIKNKMQQPAKPARLSDATLVLLSEAANRKDGMVLPAPASLRAKGGALEKVFGKLLREGLVQEVSVRSPEQAWRTDEDESRIGLKITEAGLRAIGVPAAQEHSSKEERPPTARRKGNSSRTGARPGAAAGAGAARAGAQPARPPAGVPKPGSKQALLIEQLGRPAGARIADLVSALGWQAHTLRAALTRLRQQGHTIARSKDQQGETVYRLDPPEPAPELAPEQVAV